MENRLIECNKDNLEDKELISEISSLFQDDIMRVLNEGKKFSRFSKVYSFTNEKVNMYYDLFSFKDKAVLSVMSSGDHAINAYYCGANSVDCFDINILSKIYSELKIEALKLFTFLEFKNFFLIDGEFPFSFNFYKKIRLNLSEVGRFFFDKLYEEFGFDGLNIRNSDLFHKNTDITNQKIDNNYYLKDEESYIKARNSILNKNPNFIHTDIHSLSELLDTETSYDLIFTSNISDYLHQPYVKYDYLDKYRNMTITPLLEKTNIGGVLVFAYLNDIKNSRQLSRNLMYSDDQRRRVFNVGNYKEYTFQYTTYFKQIVDRIIYIQK